MKKEIKLFNRDGADLRLKYQQNDEWILSVDTDHKYVLKYMRIIFKEHSESLDPKNYEAIDPSGGPMIGLGDIFEEYKVVGFKNTLTLIMKYEGNNN